VKENFLLGSNLKARLGRKIKTALYGETNRLIVELSQELVLLKKELMEARWAIRRIELRQIGLKQPIFTFNWFAMHEATWRKILSDLFGKENLLCLEIGTFEGRSAKWLLENVVTAPSSKLICVDTFDGSEENHDASVSNFVPISELYEVARANLAPYGSRVEVVKKTSVEFAQACQQKFDLIYVDGSHEANDVYRDGQFAISAAKSGAIIIFDDYEWGYYSDLEKNPKFAIDKLIEENGKSLVVIHRGYQIALRKI
jgi:predicted O-methyltransferase YrrM